MPSLDGSEAYNARRVAAMLGIHLVSQVLDEACTVVTAAQRIGWPWTCVLSMFKDAQNGKLAVRSREELFGVTQGYNDTSSVENKEQDTKVATSTPHKGDLAKLKADNSFIGQGDEECDMRQDEENNSTATFINNLFDMSEVEREVIREEIIIAPDNSPTGTNSQTVVKITENLLNKALDVAIKRVEVIKVVEVEDGEEKFSNIHESDYSFLADAYEREVGKDIAFYIDDDVQSNNYEKHIKTEDTTIEQVENDVTAENIAFYIEDDLPSNNDEKDEKSMDTTIVIEQVEDDVTAENVAFYIENDMPSNDDEIVEKLKDTTIVIEPVEEDGLAEKCDVVRFEDAYLTLNRDCEQCSDESEPILQDPKALIMQDVELLTASTSDDNLSTNRELSAKKELAAISAVSGASGSRKSRSSLMSRCRSQGARLISCLRGWWRRKTPGKRKEARIPGVTRGICPLSPDARRRAASLLDHRDLYSPPASRSMAWKFNTVNEALVNSSRWKEYTYEVKPDKYCVFDN